MKKYALLLAALMATASAKADLFWFNSGAILDENGTPIIADEFDSNIGYFSQLIFAGVNGVANDFVPTGTGVSGDDLVIATIFAGQGDFLYTDGFIPVQGFASVSGSGGNGNYFVRVFNAPNLDFNLGASAPVPSGATYYFQSEIHTYTHNETFPDLWDFAPDGGQTLNVVPEPSVFAMLGLSLIAMMKMRRRFHK